MESIRQEKFGFDIDEDKVIDVAKLHNKLSEEVIDPLVNVIKLSRIIPSNIKVKGYTYDNSVDHKTISVKIDAEFDTRDLSYEDLFTKYDIFIRDLKTEFNDYNITHSELPETINFDVNLKSILLILQLWVLLIKNYGYG